MTPEPGYQIVRAAPDTEPVEFPWHASVYASWITEADKRETET